MILINSRGKGNQLTPNNQNQEELVSTSKQEELTARQIFDKIIKGQIVRIPNDPVLANQLKNHLNVIKSREKKLFASLGLDFVASIIKVEILTDPEQQVTQFFGYQISLVAPKTRRKYPAFSIEQEPDASPI